MGGQRRRRDVCSIHSLVECAVSVREGCCCLSVSVSSQSQAIKIRLSLMLHSKPMLCCSKRCKQASEPFTKKNMTSPWWSTRQGCMHMRRELCKSNQPSKHLGNHLSRQAAKKQEEHAGLVVESVCHSERANKKKSIRASLSEHLAWREHCCKAAARSWEKEAS